MLKVHGLPAKECMKGISKTCFLQAEQKYGTNQYFIINLPEVIADQQYFLWLLFFLMK